MPHEYEVTLHDDTKRTAHVPDHQHHEKFQDTAVFVSIIAGTLSIADHSIKGIKWIRSYLGKLKA